MRDSAARRANRRRRRVRDPSSQLMGCSADDADAWSWRTRCFTLAVSGASRSAGAQHRLEAGGEAAPALQLLAQCAPAGGGEPIVARASVVVGGAPIARDQALLLQPLQRRIERALVHVEHAL